MRLPRVHHNEAVRPPEVLVAIEYADGTAGVVREGGTVWLTDDVAGAAGTGLEDHTPRVMGMVGDRTLEGGLLPAGAVTALVTDDAGVRRAAAAANGAWAILREQPCDGRVSPVCFRDAAGVTVLPELPADWPRAPVLDAGEPCPACDAVGWDEVRATDESHGTQGSHDEPTPFVVCRSCGHEHSIGMWSTYAPIGEEPGAEDLARMIRRAEAEQRRRAREALGDLRFPLYAVRGWSGRIGGWGSSNGLIDSVTVEHGARAGEAGTWVHVETEHEPHAYESERARVRSTLLGALHEDPGDWPERSHAALAILLHVRERELLRVAAGAIAERRTLLLDGRPVSFQTLTAGRLWSAVRRHGELVISVSARELDASALELTAVADPRGELLPEPDWPRGGPAN